MSWGEIIATSLPFAIIIGAFGYMIWKARKQYSDYYKHVNGVNQLATDSLELNREMVVLLKEIRDELKANRR